MQSLNRYNSALDCSISLKFGTELDRRHITNVQRERVKGQVYSVSDLIGSSRNVISQERRAVRAQHVVHH